MLDDLTLLERAVVALARTDPVRSLRRQGLFAGWIGGAKYTPQPLADARLEALRRYAVLLRKYGDALPERERVIIREAGFNRLKIAAVDRTVLSMRARKKSGTSGTVSSLLVGMR
jgi:hypothetical protein